MLHEAARAGAGLAVLPCYLGDADPALQRVGGVVPEVFADQWLLVHRDLRALPRVRAVMDAVIELFQRERAVAGRPLTSHTGAIFPGGSAMKKIDPYACLSSAIATTAHAENGILPMASKPEEVGLSSTQLKRLEEVDRRSISTRASCPAR